MKLNDVFGLLNIKMGNTFGYQPKTFRIFVIKDDYNAYFKNSEPFVLEVSNDDDISFDGAGG